MTAVGYLIPKFICEEFPEDYSDVLDVVEVDGRLCFTSSEHGPDDEASVTPAPDLTMLWAHCYLTRMKWYNKGGFC